MAVLADTEIAKAAASAGFSGQNLITAVAVALAESNGETTAVNDAEPDGSTSYGLWQINSVHASLLDSGTWRDPKSNAHMAYVIWQGAGRNWTPWGAYNDQRYRFYLIRAQRAVASTGGTSGGQTGGVPPTTGVDFDLNPLDDVRDALGQIGRIIDAVTDPHMWLRNLTVLVGVAMAGIIVVQLVAGTSVGETVKTVGKVSIDRGGKVVKNVVDNVAREATE